MTDDERIIRDALAAGPTPGPWTPMPAGAGEQCVARVNNTEAVPPVGVDLAHESVDASYIAACSPDRIERVLAELERLREAPRTAHEVWEREAQQYRDEDVRLRAELAEAHAEAREQARLLGISGSVEARLLARVAELEREVAEVKRDAERYRWLRDSKIADDADRWICAHECTVHEVAELDGERLDAAIDRALQVGYGRANAFAWDGEGYWLCVATADENEQVPSYYGGECRGSPEIGERIMRALNKAEDGE